MFLFSAGFFHWFLQRFTAGFLFLLGIVSFFFQSSLLGYLLFIGLSLHLKLGVESLINDYCHDKILKIFGIMQLHLFFIYTLKFLIFVM